MAIPGYDSSNVSTAALESVGATVSVVAAVVPDSFHLERSDRDPPIDALSRTVDLHGVEDLKAVEAVRLSLAYDPSKLPPGASPTDVAVAVRVDDDSTPDGADEEPGWVPLESTVDLEATTVEAVLSDRPPGSTIVAGYDDRDSNDEPALE